jgi:heme exporter protein D
MQFSSLSEFISMGGYGFYVWLSFGSATLILSLLLIASKKRLKQVLAAIAKQQVREEKLIQARLSRVQQNSDSANSRVKVDNL